MKRAALEALQQGLENVARVVDAHGNLSTGDETFEPYYSLETAIDYLREAEQLLEGEQSCV